MPNHLSIAEEERNEEFEVPPVSFWRQLIATNLADNGRLKKKFVCAEEFCTTSFWRVADFLLHWGDHEGCELSCPLDNEKFLNKPLFIQHMELSHGLSAAADGSLPFHREIIAFFGSVVAAEGDQKEDWAPSSSAEAPRMSSEASEDDSSKVEIRFDDEMTALFKNVTRRRKRNFVRRMEESEDDDSDANELALKRGRHAGFFTSDEEEQEDGDNQENFKDRAEEVQVQRFHEEQDDDSEHGNDVDDGVDDDDRISVNASQDIPNLVDEEDDDGEDDDEASGYDEDVEEEDDEVQNEQQPRPRRVARKRRRGRAKKWTATRTVRAKRTSSIYEIRKPRYCGDLEKDMTGFFNYFEEQALRSFAVGQLVSFEDGHNKENQATTAEETPMSVEDFQASYRRRPQDSRIRRIVDNDFSHGIEPSGLPVINTLEAQQIPLPTNFEYLEKNMVEDFEQKYPFKHAKPSKMSCQCSGPCGVSCRCVGASIRHGKSLIVGNSVLRVSDSFDKSLVVACGKDCGCPPNCGNRVAQNVSLPHLELFCRDAFIGYGVRTRRNIGVGQIVCELVGRITDLEPGDHTGIDPDYSWTIYHTKSKKTEADGGVVMNGDSFPFIARNILKRWKKVDDVQLEKDVVLDVKNVGNVMRFVSHSEYPNILPVRLVENDFRPGKLRMVFLAIRPIEAGEELFTDYGADYAALLECRCKNATCGDGKKVLKELLEQNKNMDFLLKLQREKAHWIPDRNVREDRELVEAKVKKLYQTPF